MSSTDKNIKEAKIRNFTSDEKNMLTEACKPHAEIINNPARSLLAKKCKAWEAIHQQFNSNPHGYEVNKINILFTTV